MIHNELEMVENRLIETIQLSGPDIETVGSHIISGSAKRIRPALFLLAAYQPGKNLIPLIDIAVAFELMHTASLMHDDVIDQAATRRGKNAIHIKWSNKIAVLTGDHFLSQVFRIFVETGRWDLMEIAVEIVENITAGEVEQAFAVQNTKDLEAQYFRWIGKKSASFFAGCCKAGSLMSGGNAEQQSLWFDYGYNLGIAFQLIDDLLDYTADTSVLGKATGTDLREGKLTLPVIYALKRATPDDRRRLETIIRDMDITDSDLETVQGLIGKDGGIAYTRDRARQHIEQAKKCLDIFSASEPRTLLLQLADYVLVRNM